MKELLMGAAITVTAIGVFLVVVMVVLAISIWVLDTYGWMDDVTKEGDRD